MTEQEANELAVRLLNEIDIDVNCEFDGTVLVTLGFEADRRLTAAQARDLAALLIAEAERTELAIDKRAE